MTKNHSRSIRILAPFTIALMVFWFVDGNNEITQSPPAKIKAVPEKALYQSARSPASVPQTVLTSSTVHTKPGLSHPVWKSALEKNLILQGGGNLKNAVIEKIDSFEWKIGNAPIKVDSLIVKIEHVKGYRSSFRAIVDSSNGKILQTWDHPVNDNFDSKSKAEIKIDSRYHND